MEITLKLSEREYCMIIDAMEEGMYSAEAEAKWKKYKEEELNEWADSVYKLIEKLVNSVDYDIRNCEYERG